VHKPLALQESVFLPAFSTFIKDSALLREHRAPISEPTLPTLPFLPLKNRGGVILFKNIIFARGWGIGDLMPATPTTVVSSLHIKGAKNER
jgi:hypothetical protein